MINLLHGDCLEQMKTLDDNSVDSIVSDPPYGISFMAKKWDYDVPSVEVWNEAMRVLKPGGHALIACGTRTQHRMVVNIEDAGFEIRDVVSWIYGSGFPKSLNVSKAIDKMDAGDAQQARRYKFTEWVRSNGITPKQINICLGASDMGRHYTDILPTGKQPAIMTREHLEACRHLFSEVPQWVEDECDKRSVESENFKRREVVGTRKAVNTKKHRIACAVSAEGFDKTESHIIDITAPATDEAKQWDGWGTALKPSCEFFTLCRKPLSEKTIAKNVLKWGTGGINIDGCRVESGDSASLARNNKEGDNGWKNASGGKNTAAARAEQGLSPQGRFPANLIHDGSQEVLDLFPETKSGGPAKSRTKDGNIYGKYKPIPNDPTKYNGGDQGSAARFFYCPKASKKDRNEGNNHPTVKPTALMAYLCRLITPTGGIVLDPYMGSGSTGKAAVQEGFSFVGCELDEDYFDIATARVTNGQDLEVRGENF